MRNFVAMCTVLLVWIILAPVSDGQSISGSALPDSARIVLLEIMRDANVKSVVVTRTRSTPADQVRVMYNFIQRYGVESAKRMYGAEGDAVVDVYSRSDLSEATRKSAMLSELNRQLPRAQRNGRLMHLSSQYVVFDLSLRRFLPRENVDAFVDAARKHGSTKRVLGKDEGEKEAIHVELMVR